LKLLAHVAEHQKREMDAPSQKELARVISLSEDSAGNICRKLERENLLYRPHGKRSGYLLTEMGHRVLQAATPQDDSV
jgi:DNA-binding IscR family transcriptional regulator